MSGDRRRRGLVYLALGALLVLGSVGGTWALAPDRDAGGEAGDVGYDSLLVGVQGPGPSGGVVMYEANGTHRWGYANGTDGVAISYQDVSMLEDGRVLATFADDGYRNCGRFESPCKRTGVRVLDPEPRPHRVSQWSYPVRTREDSEVHDAEVTPAGELLVADMEYESVFTVNRTTGERTWTWNASDHYDAPADPTKVDWLHINDVDRIGEGRYLVSVRNANQLVIVERGRGVVEVINEDRDPSVLDKQHNPQWLGDGRVLVADSENHRVVELRRNDSSGRWRVAWTVYRAGGIGFDWPRDADRLPSGNTVITDSRNNRVVVVDEKGELVRSYATPPLPYEADALPAGERPNPTDAVTPFRSAAPGLGQRDLPVLSPLLNGMRHVVPLPYWVAEWHLLAVALGAALTVRGGALYRD